MHTYGSRRGDRARGALVILACSTTLLALCALGCGSRTTAGSREGDASTADIGAGGDAGSAPDATNTLGDGEPSDGSDDSQVRASCGNGRVEGDERCDDGNQTAGDGCETDCTPTPTPGATAFRVQTIKLMEPHVWANVFFRCRDLTDDGIGSLAPSVNDSLQTNVDDYLINFLTVFRPLDPAAPSSPAEFISGECTDGGICQPGAGSTMTSNMNNQAAGGTCFAADPAALNPSYTAPNEVIGPCFVSDEEELDVEIGGGVVVPLTRARISATYDGGPPPTKLISGVLSGFLSEQSARSTRLPPEMPMVGDQPLYAILAAGGDEGSSCSAQDDRDTVDDSGSTVRGFWFYLNFTAQQVGWLEE
jgi:cysteine-rich repeat protein